MTTADDPSAERISDAAPRPIPAKAATETSSVSRSESQSPGSSASKSATPSTRIVANWSAKTNRVDSSTEARYIGAGSGVERRRLSRPDSRRITSWIVRPAKAVFAAP